MKKPRETITTGYDLDYNHLLFSIYGSWNLTDCKKLYKQLGKMIKYLEWKKKQKKK